MNWYFASRTRHQVALATLSKQLENKGEGIKSTWVYGTETLLPYSENIEKSKKIAVMDIKGVVESDVFVLISDPAGTDMFAELGAALGKDASSPGSIRIYIVGEHSKRSLIQLHPAIVHAPTLKDVFAKEGINYANFTFPSFD